jgi:hypothetical protein
LRLYLGSIEALFRLYYGSIETLLRLYYGSMKAHEINAVVDTSGSWFSPAVNAAFRDPRMRFVFSDATAWVSLHRASIEPS